MTVAFGMGIGKASVWFLIFLFDCLLRWGYYQKTGGPGCIELPAGCHLYDSYRDILVHRVFIENSDGDRDQKEGLRENPNGMVRKREGLSQRIL